MSQSIEAPPPSTDPLFRRAVLVGVLAFVPCAAWGLLDPAQFFRSYLLAWLFWLGIALGCLGILMLQHLSGGAWGVVIRRILESGTRTLPMMGALFVPVVLGVKLLYVWARPEAVRADVVLQEKSPYLNVPFFIVRAVVYFAVWVALAKALNRWSAQQDDAGGGAPGGSPLGAGTTGRKMTVLSAPGIALYVLTMTFASVDWIMSLEPHWFSTIFGALLVAGQALGAMSFTIAALYLLSRNEPMSRLVQQRHFHDLGKLLLTFVMIWSYFAFSQFLIIWAGNLPEEIPWYLERLKGGWEWAGLALVVQHGQDDAGDPGGPSCPSAAAMRLVDLLWMTAPASHSRSFAVHWMDLALPIAVGGFWVAAFARELGRRPLLPLGEPQLADALSEAHG